MIDMKTIELVGTLVGMIEQDRTLKGLTKFVSSRKTVQVTRRWGKHWRKGQNSELLVTIGRPNYRARQAAKRARRHKISLDRITVTRLIKAKK